MASSETSAHTHAATRRSSSSSSRKKISFCNFQLKKHSGPRRTHRTEKWDDKNGKYCTLAHTNYFLRFNQIRQANERAVGRTGNEMKEWSIEKDTHIAPANECKCRTDKYKCILFLPHIEWVSRALSTSSPQLPARECKRRIQRERARETKNIAGQTALESERCRRGP